MANVSFDEVANFVAGRAAIGHFVEAVHALSDDPRRTNVARYLAASRALDESRPAMETCANSSMSQMKGNHREKK